MNKVQSALGLSLLALPFATLLPADEDKGTHRPFPSPRKSGEGRVAFAANNVQLLGWLTLADLSGGSAASGNDCWGYTSPSGREYAIVGLDNGTAFVEVTDPGAPALLSFHSGPTSLWRDMKVFGDNAYVVTEGGGGIQVFDMSAIDSGTVTLVGTQASGGCTTATHNVAIDTTSGFLYRCGGSSSPCSGGPQGIVIYNLNANPNNPPLVGQWNNRYVHDAVVVVSTRPGPLNGAQLAFCAADDGSGGGTANLHILNVTNKASITTVATEAYTSNAFSHQVWLTPDQRYAYLNDELDESSFGFTTRTRIFDVSDPTNPLFLGFFTSGVDAIDHNLYVTADKIFEANYRSGLRVFDNTVPTAPTVYGFFDTWEGDDDPEFNGLWSNYPFFPSETVIGSDLEKGLFVWRLGAAKLTFAFPGGVPELLAPAGGVVQFEVSEDAPGDLEPGTVEFHYSTGGPFSSVSATWLGGDSYEALLPSATCGDTIEYYVSAESSDGATWTDPPAAPMAQVHIATAAYGEIVALDETFETNTGWQVNVAADLTGFPTATTGTWIRANPVGTAAQPEDDHTPDPGTMCFVTANGPVGGGVGEADIDNGATALRSPVLDASGLSDPYVSYWRWFSNNAGAAPGEDTMTVHISNNGGSSWVLLETVGPTGDDSVGGWIEHTARIADFVTPTNNMRLRFRASDLFNGSIVEAAVDDLRIVDFDCEPPPAVTISSVSPDTGPFDGGNVVTITGTNFQAGQTTVFFGANQATALNVLNSTTIQVRVPRAPGPVSGKLGALDREADVTVQNPGTATLANGYTYVMKHKNL